jgi:hypothetical protein
MAARFALQIARLDRVLIVAVGRDRFGTRRCRLDLYEFHKDFEVFRDFRLLTYQGRQL